MNEEELRKSEADLESLYVWLVPLFTIPVVWWGFSILKHIFVYISMYVNSPNGVFNVYSVLVILNSLSARNMISILFLIIWIFLGIKGLKISKKCINKITDYKMARRVYRISLTMIIISIFIVLNTIVFFSLYRFQ